MSNEGQGLFLTLAQAHLHLKIKTCFSQKPLDHLPNFDCKFLDTRKHDAGHMTKIAAMPIYNNNNTLEILV